MAKAKKAEKAVAISEILGKSWSIFKKNWKTIYILLALPLVLTIIQEMLYGLTDITGVSAFVVQVVFWLAQMIVSMGIIKAMLYIVRGKEVDVDTILSTKGSILPFLFASILVSLIVLFGFVLLIIPGIYLAIKYMFVPYLLIDKELGAMESLKMSSEMTKDIKWSLFAFSLVALLIGYGGILFMLIGLLVTLPYVTVAYSVLYERVRLARKV